MDCNTPGFLVFYHLPEFAKTYVHWVRMQSLPAQDINIKLLDTMLFWSSSSESFGKWAFWLVLSFTQIKLFSILIIDWVLIIFIYKSLQQPWEVSIIVSILQESEAQRGKQICLWSHSYYMADPRLTARRLCFSTMWNSAHHCPKHSSCYVCNQGHLRRNEWTRYWRFWVVV